MLPLLLISFAILQHVLCSCPAGFDLVRDGQCRGFYGSATLYQDKAWSTAVTKCEEIQGLPPIIHNEEDQLYWKTQKKMKSDYFLLGLVCNTNIKRFQWADGSPVDYIPPCHDIALLEDCDPSYSWGMFNNNGIWYQAHNPWIEDDFDIYCTTQLHQPFPPTNECGDFEHDSEDDICYQVQSNAVSWNQAEQSCRELGAHLASIHNDNENSFLRRLAVSNGAVSGVFLGATFSGKGNNYGWIDGSQWDYSNFYPGFPMSGFGDCVALDTSVASGQWMNVDCAAKLPVACVREKKTVVERNVTCNAQYWEEGEIITSPGFPYNAALPCDYYLTVDAGKNVEVEIAFLEANSCCDFLVLYDGYVGGAVLANITGEIRNAAYTTSASNIMRVSWQPNGGVNVMGMAMTFRGV